jgi:hypothetical protein
MVSTGYSSARWKLPIALSVAVALLSAVLAVVGPTAAGAAVADSWTVRDTSGADLAYNAVAYGDGRFVASACAAGLGNEFAQSSDGVDWTVASSDHDGCYRSIAYGEGRFLAAAMYTNQVSTSTDGETWTSSCAKSDCTLQSEFDALTYGDGTFVGVSFFPGNRVLVSEDGITSDVLEITADAASIQWQDVTYGNGRWVAVSHFGKAMYSTDLENWTVVDMAANGFYDVTYGDGMFVAVKRSATAGANVQTSTDGATWTLVDDVPGRSWNDVVYADSTFVAVGSSGTGDRVMTSTDAQTWTVQSTPADNGWVALTYGDGMFAAVASSGTGNRIMTSGVLEVPEPTTTTTSTTSTSTTSTSTTSTSTTSTSTTSTSTTSTTVLPTDRTAAPTTAELEALPPGLSVPSTARQGQVVSVRADGFIPGELVDVILRSEPRLLAQVDADERGAIDVDVVIPDDVAAGPHHLYAFGRNSRTGVQAPIEVLAASSPPTVRTQAPLAFAG